MSSEPKDSQGPSDPDAPWHDPERVLLPSERTPRRQRTPWLVIVALVASIIAHLAALSGCVGLLLLWVPFKMEEKAQPQESMPVFVVPTPAPSPPIPPPETDKISDRDTQANSPGDQAPTPAGGSSPREAGTPEPREPPPGEPAPASDREPSTAPVAKQPAQVTPEDRRERLADALRGLRGQGNDWGSLATPGDGASSSSGLSYSYGDNAFQIESKADVDWGPWSRKVHGLVRSNWYSVMPVAARVGMKGIVKVRFVVHRDGTITDYELLDSAGLLPLDQTVQTALINLSNPLPPLPLRETDEDTIRVTYTFIYNLPDERDRRAWERQRWLEKKRAQGGG